MERSAFVFDMVLNSVAEEIIELSAPETDLESKKNSKSKTSKFLGPGKTLAALLTAGILAVPSIAEAGIKDAPKNFVKGVVSWVYEDGQVLPWAWHLPYKENGLFDFYDKDKGIEFTIGRAAVLGGAAYGVSEACKDEEEPVPEPPGPGVSGD